MTLGDIARAVLLLSMIVTSHASAAEVSLSDKGLVIDSSVGKLTLEYPKLGGGPKVSGVTVAGVTATVKYEGGAEIVVEVKGDGTILFKPSNLPAEVKNLQTEMTISRPIAKACKWSIDDGEAKAFPSEKPAKPQVYQGQGATFTLRGHDGDGKGVTFTTPASYAYNELTDCREWNWDVVQWKVHTPVNPDWNVYTYKVGAPGQAPAKEQTQQRATTPPAPPVEPGTLNVSLRQQRIELSMGPDRGLSLNYPYFFGNDNKLVKAHDITLSANNTVASLKYANGATGTVTLVDGRKLAIAFTGVPAAATSFRLDSQIPFNFTQGGTFAVGDGDPRPFPPEQPAKPHIYQGNATMIALGHPQGGGVRITLPDYSYQQLTDNREWNWKVFAWFGQVPLSQDGVNRTFTIALDPLDGSASSSQPLVDRFGQSTRVDYPGKVKSIDELKQDVEDEKAYYAGFNPPQLDAYGGLPGSGQRLGLKKTGFFHVQKIGESQSSHGSRWVLVNPEGNATFHLGICVFGRAAYTYVEGRESIYEWVPPAGGEFATARPEGYWNPSSVSFHQANMIRKYGPPIDQDRFASIMIDRVRRFGFNAAGAFSGGRTQVHVEMNFPYVSEIPHSEHTHGLKRIPGIRETWDPFDEKNVARFDANCAKSVAARADDPLLIGYFLVNEPLYQDIPRVVPTLKGEWACKRRLVEMLRDKYATIDAFNAAWNMQAASFDELIDQGIPVRTQAAADDMHTYTGLFLETYFKLVRDTMRKHDPNHMLIGNRLQSGTANSRQLCEISKKYLDVFSLNYYTYGLDRAFLDRLHAWTGDVPMMFTEFYWNSPSDSGLPGGVKDVSSQEERGLAYRHYVEHAAAIPYVVGVQWFTLVDCSLTGQWFSRYNGENPNSGLFSVADRPWKVMIEHMARTNHSIYDVYLGGKTPFVFDDPRFTDKGVRQESINIARAPAPLTIDGSSEGWPGIPAHRVGGNRLVQGTPGAVEAAFKLAWDHEHLYVIVDVRDPTPMRNDRSADTIWQGDGIELFIGHEKLEQSGAMLFTDRQILISAGQVDDAARVHFVNVPEQPACRVAVVLTGEGYTLEAAIPLKALGLTPQTGREIRFDLAIDDSADGQRRDRQLMWNGIARNSGDRTAWGRARFTD